LNEGPETAPLVSVVIPTFNRAQDLRRCLDSLVAQSFKKFEVLVCDDGSTDNSESVAQEYCARLDLRFETAENFGGPARPRNRGISLARGSYVAFLDSDDWWAPEKLTLSVERLEKGAEVVYHDMFLARHIGQEHFPDQLVSSEPRSTMFDSLLCCGMSIPNSSVVVRKELLERIGGISEDTSLISVEDYDTWVRIALTTDRFQRIAMPLGYYWAGGGNISAASPKQMSRIKVLYSQYVGLLPQNRQAVAFGFLEYRIARIAQQIGDWETAANGFAKAMRSSIEMKTRLKALLFFALCRVRAHGTNDNR
jgi:glycosyltransferase involved in cell wall biosynthesis